MPVISCPLCQQSASSVFFQSSLGVCVRSDWTALSESVTVYQCSVCSHLHKDAANVKRMSDYINYHVMDDSPEQDKLQFAKDRPSGRSSTILEHLRQKRIIDSRSRILDYGCNRGAFLKLLEGSGHAGFDVSEHYRPIIEGLGKEYYTLDSPPPENSYDAIVLIHVAEHLESMARDLSFGVRALKKSGAILIQVPDIVLQPTDLYVADHHSHFLPENLIRSMASIGLECQATVESIIPGEQTAIFKPSVDGRVKSWRDVEQEANAARNKRAGEHIRDYLFKAEARMADLSAAGRQHFIYGAGLIGTLVAGKLQKQVAGFIDDNPGSKGRSLHGIPIFLSSEIPKNCESIVVAVPPTAALQVANRCRSLGYEPLIPFDSSLP